MRKLLARQRVEMMTSPLYYICQLLTKNARYTSWNWATHIFLEWSTKGGGSPKNIPPRTSFVRVLFLIERTCTCHLHYAYTLLLFPSPLSHHSCLVKFARIKTALAAWIRLNPVLYGIKNWLLLKKFFVVLCFEKRLWVMGLGPPLHGQFLILKINMEKKKW